MVNWDDLRIFAKAARSTSMFAASLELGMDPSTVGRRISRLETQLKSALLVRGPTGIQLTRAGEDLLKTATQVEAAMAIAPSAGGHSPMSGVIRICMQEALGTSVFIAAVIEQATKHRDLTLEFSSHVLDLHPWRGAFEIALSTVLPRFSDFNHERIGTFEVGLYANEEFAHRLGGEIGAADLDNPRYVRFIHDEEDAEASLMRLCAAQQPIATSTSFLLHLALIRAGVGCGLLPCFVANKAGFVRLAPELPFISRPVYLSVRTELSDRVNIRAVRRWVLEGIETLNPRLSPSLALSA